MQNSKKTIRSEKGIGIQEWALVFMLIVAFVILGITYLVINRKSFKLIDPPVKSHLLSSYRHS